MDITLIATTITFILNIALFLLGELTSSIVITSGAFVIGILVGELITKIELYEDDDYDGDEFGYDEKEQMYDE